MAINWNSPELTTRYESVLSELKARDEEALKWTGTGSNRPQNMKRWNNVSQRFERWDGTSWIPMILSLTGGGTGATTASGARDNLGLTEAATRPVTGAGKLVAEDAEATLSERLVLKGQVSNQFNLRHSMMVSAEEGSRTIFRDKENTQRVAAIGSGWNDTSRFSIFTSLTGAFGSNSERLQVRGDGSVIAGYQTVGGAKGEGTVNTKGVYTDGERGLHEGDWYANGGSVPQTTTTNVFNAHQRINNLKIESQSRAARFDFENPDSGSHTFSIFDTTDVEQNLGLSELRFERGSTAGGAYELRTRFNYGNPDYSGTLLGEQSSGFQGPGTLNCSGAYKDGVEYVFSSEVRAMTVSGSVPQAFDGENGDLWFAKDVGIYYKVSGDWEKIL